MTRLTRRELAAALAGAAVPALAGGEDEKKKASPLDGAAAALLAVVKARHGEHLSDEQLKRVRAGIASGLRSGELLRRVKLPPADEPAFVFQADLP
jgi:hypothetical protein